MIKCNHCEKYCGNAGSIKLHMRSKHKDVLSKTLEAANKTSEAANVNMVSSVDGLNKTVNVPKVNTNK